jgi:ABC-type antimicrobial peptide transport system permease subunit
LLGIYSVMAYMTSVLTHEIGVRIALGAKRSTIFSMVLRKGLVIVTAGLGLGLFASLLLLPALRSQVWGVSTFDAPTFLLVGAALSITGLVACGLPALRATRIDPLNALRYE